MKSLYPCCVHLTELAVIYHIQLLVSLFFGITPSILMEKVKASSTAAKLNRDWSCARLPSNRPIGV